MMQYDAGGNKITCVGLEIGCPGLPRAGHRQRAGHVHFQAHPQRDVHALLCVNIHCLNCALLCCQSIQMAEGLPQ